MTLSFQKSVAASVAPEIALAEPPNPATRALLRQVGILFFIALICSPAFTPAAALLRIALPAATFVIGFLMLRRGRLSTYVSFVIWLTLLTPFVRRVVDLHSGWIEGNLLLLAPLTATLPCLAVLPSLVRGRAGRASLPFLVIFSVVSYGFLLNITQGRLVEGGVDYLRWVLPPCLGALLVVNNATWEEVQADIVALCTIAVPLLSLYAAIQFVFVPGWDAFWMNNVEMDSIGVPAPFEVRVFSTMASPGPFAYFLLTALTLLTGAVGLTRWIGLASGGAALALTAVRTSWLGLGLALAYLFAFSSHRVRASIVMAVAVCAVIFPIAFSFPPLQRMLVERVQSMTSLSDTSYEARALQYAGMFDALSDEPWGRGLALRGALKGKVAANGFEVTDGGFIEIFASLGLAPGVFYLTSILVLIARTFGTGREGKANPGVIAAQAIAIVSFMQLTSGMTFTGEGGILLWAVMGAAIARQQGAARSRVGPVEALLV
jgi:hypothetical protein